MVGLIMANSKSKLYPSYIDGHFEKTITYYIRFEGKSKVYGGNL